MAPPKRPRRSRWIAAEAHIAEAREIVSRADYASDCATWTANDDTDGVKNALATVLASAIENAIGDAAFPNAAIHPEIE